ncbi:MAG: glycosyltransferase [Desulfococcaceae bacterium]|jgi:glycosyltransferase involved in cell wall biosynthesis|nr:glycosyltransferase [Desulfococcaceae bacterium]
MLKIDLHVHSKYSERPSQWILQKIGCPESFSGPLQIYRTAQKKGMSLVTITDHNSIQGALEIAHLPNTFVSEEITSYFPEDGCKIHVLAWNITEKQHEEIGRLRKNIYDLAAWLHGEKIVNAVAHPLYAVNERLHVRHFEQMLLLFQNFELNGARNAAQNRNLEQILGQLRPWDIERLADKYQYSPLFKSPWQKNLVGGSDDHSGLNIARTYTRIRDAGTPGEALMAIGEGKASVAGQASTPRTMAHNLYGIAWQFYRKKLNLDRHSAKDRLLQLTDRFLLQEAEEEKGLVSKIYCFFSERKRRRNGEGADSLMGMIRRETDALLREIPELPESEDMYQNDPQKKEEQWFAFVNRVSEKVIAHSADHLLKQLSGANLFSLFHTLGSAGGIYSLLAPYFVAFSQFTKDRELTETLLREYAGRRYREKKSNVSLGHFTDTFYEVNGVAKTLRQQVQTALEKEKDLTVITCDPEKKEEENGVRNFRPVGVYEIPEYEEQKLFYPPFLQMLNYCYEQGFTHIHSATPGPVGLAALAIARILKLPLSGTYHTAFPQYARYLTGDQMMEDLTWKFTIWYYQQMDTIYVSSKSSAGELKSRGIQPERIRLIPRGIDIKNFHPSKRNADPAEHYGIRDKLCLLYVGRVSKEKNLPVLAEAFKKLHRVLSHVHLMIVGDGPWLKEMRREMKDMPCTFTGYLDGEALSSVYASGDIFVFPSTTDTFGNVVLEAQASGLPVIVTDKGGPCENMIPDKTGMVVKGNDAQELTRAMYFLASEDSKRNDMGRAARAYMEDRSFENAFIRSWALYEEKQQNGTKHFAKSA